MQVASRPRFTAGVAAVGASLVVASTVAPVPDIHLPAIHLPALRTAEVNLAAAVDPLAIYSQVLQDALANIATLAGNAAPGQVLNQILANQLGSLATVGGALQTAVGGIGADVATQVQAAVSQLAAGNVAGAVGALAQIPAGVSQQAGELGNAVLSVLAKPVDNLMNVVKAFTSDTLGTELILAGFVAPLISVPFAAVAAIQNVIGAVGTFNPTAIANALLAAPATVLDGLLNGGYGPDLAPIIGNPFPVKAGGLFGLPTLVFPTDGSSFFLNTGGPIAALEALLKKIAGALAPQAATTAVKAAQPDPASVPSTAASTITLKTGSSAVSLPAKSTPSAEPAASDSTGVDATKPAGTDTPKDSSAASGTTPATSTDGAESGSATKDSTTKPDSTDASDSTKPAGTGTDAPTGTKAEPHHTAGSGSTTSHETGTDSAGGKGNAASGHTSKGADKGGHKHAHDASHAHASK